MSPSGIYLALGANMGDREANIRRALALLEEHGAKVVRCSLIRETAPVGGPPQGAYLNAACEVDTTLAPLELLDLLQRIEQQMGRVRTVPNGPRPIDIDILFYHDIIMSTPRLTLPHPRIRERAFVMDPLRDISNFV